jgi:hypothetical protein
MDEAIAGVRNNPTKLDRCEGVLKAAPFLSISPGSLRRTMARCTNKRDRCAYPTATSIAPRAAVVYMLEPYRDRWDGPMWQAEVLASQCEQETLN